MTKKLEELLNMPDSKEIIEESRNADKAQTQDAPKADGKSCPLMLSATTACEGQGLEWLI